MGHWYSMLCNADMENYGHAGKSVDKIIRSAQRHVLDNPNGDYIYCIGIGHTQRFDTSTGEIPNIRYPYLSMESELGVETVQINKLVDADKRFAREFTKWFEYPFLEYQTLSKLVMLHDFLLFHGCDFIIHNLAFNYARDTDYKFGEQWISEVDVRPRIVNFFSDSFHDQMQAKNYKPYNFEEYGWAGHHSEPAHKDYAEYLYSKYKQLTPLEKRV